MTLPWLSALQPYVERDDFRIPLDTPIHMPSGQMIHDVAGVSMRFPMWTGAPFVDDFARKSAAMIELDGEHLFAELAVLRLLEKDGWNGRWVSTFSTGKEVWKYLTEWRDVPRAEQRNRPIEDTDARQLIAQIAGLNKPDRYAGCWDLYAWRGDDVAFFEVKRASTRSKDVIAKQQADWLRSALFTGRASLDSFCFVQWEYQ